MKRLWGALWLVLAMTVLAACGHSTSPSSTATAPGIATVPHSTVDQRCGTGGGGYMGCAINASPTHTSTNPTIALVPAGAKDPDVSAYQGCSINWKNVGAKGAVLKLGESDDHVDICASSNLAGLRAAKKTAIVYWFMRPGGKAAEAAYIVKTLKAEHYAVNTVDEYTSPGVYSGGGCLKHLWIAAYSGTAHPPSPPCSTSIVAWQYTDAGYISGISHPLDVSVNYGLFDHGSHTLVLDTEVPGLAGYDQPIAAYVLKHDALPAPRKVSCAPFKSQRTVSACKALRASEAKLKREISSERTRLRKLHCYRYRYLGECPADLKHGDRLHADLTQLLNVH